jgi:hypothetical protein
MIIFIRCLEWRNQKNPDNAEYQRDAKETPLRPDLVRVGFQKKVPDSPA